MGYNKILGIMSQQQNANMQSHMREYENQEEASKIRILKDNFQGFIDAICNYSLYIYLNKDPKPDLNDLLNSFCTDTNMLAEYLNLINEELLNDADFLTKDDFIHLGESKMIIYSLRYLKDSHFKISVSYYAATSNDKPNIIRIETENKYLSNEPDYGCIDFCSNNEIIVNSFETKLLKDDRNDDEKNSNIIKNMDEVEKYCMQIFELADLKTTDNIHR